MSTLLPKLPYIVIDQNCCRRRNIVDGLFRRCQREGQRILLPDTAIYEFSNVSSPYLTWRRSLEEVCREPGLVVAGRSVSEMMREEMQTGSPVMEVMDAEVTPRFQQLLTELRGGDDKRMNLALKGVAGLIDKEKWLRERHPANKAIVTSLREFWKKSLPQADLKPLRKQDEATFIRILAELETAAIVFQAAKGNGCSDESAYALTVNPSVYGHTVYALAALALDWLARGGLEAIDPGKITNDFFDLDYTVTATFGSDLVTEDERATRIYSALLKAFERRTQIIETLETADRQKQ